GIASLILRIPRPILVVSAVLGAATVALTAWAVANDPLEYDFRNLRSVREESSEAQKINRRVTGIVGSSGAGNAIAVVVPTHPDVAVVRDELNRRIATGDAPYQAVKTIDGLLPEDQVSKLPVLREIRET